MGPLELQLVEGKKMLVEIVERVKNDMSIAEFLGAEFVQHYAPNKDTKMSGMYAEFSTDKKVGVWHDNKSFHGIEYLKYKSDWNWLEKAVQKMETLGFRLVIGNRNTEDYISMIHYDGYDSNLKLAFSNECSINNCLVFGAKTKLESAFNAVVKFCEFYKAYNK